MAEPVPMNIARSRTQRLLRSTTVRTSTTGLVVYGLAAITGPLLARSLGPSSRGDLAAVLVPSEMLSWALCFGLPAAAVYYSDRYSIRQMMTATWLFAAVVGWHCDVAVWFFVPSYLQDHDAITVPWLRVMLLVSVPVPAGADRHPAPEAAYRSGGLQFLPLDPVGPRNHHDRGAGRDRSARSDERAVGGIRVLGDCVLRRAHLHESLAGAVAGPAGAPRHGPLRRTAVRGKQGEPSDQPPRSVLMVGIVAPAQLGIYAIAATAAGLSSAAADGIGYVVFARLREESEPNQAWAVLLSGLRWTLLASSGIGVIIGSRRSRSFLCSSVTVQGCGGAAAHPSYRVRFSRTSAVW